MPFCLLLGSSFVWEYVGYLNLIIVAMQVLLQEFRSAFSSQHQPEHTSWQLSAIENGWLMLKRKSLMFVK